MDNKLIVTAAPHITSVDSTQKIMQRVCIALVPTLIASVIIFGINSLILTAVTVAACVIFEYLYCKLVGREVACLLYTSPSPRDLSTSRMPSSA